MDPLISPHCRLHLSLVPPRSAASWGAVSFVLATFNSALAPKLCPKKRLRLTLPLSHSVINFGSLIPLLKGRRPPPPSHIFQLRVTFSIVRAPSYQNRLSGLNLFKTSETLLPLSQFLFHFFPPLSRREIANGYLGWILFVFR